MDIKQLEYFCAVAEEHSVSAAAKILHVAQPPVSRQIAALEEELGVQLFIRGNRGMELTEAGENFHLQSRRLMAGMEQLAEDARSIGAGEGGTIKIGAIYSTVPYAMPYIEKYHLAHPQVKLYIRLGSPQDLLKDLNSGELDALFLRSSSTEKEDLYSRRLGEDTLELIMTRSTDPAPGLSSVPIELLRDVSLCLLRSDDIWSYNEYLLRECQRNGFTPRISFHCYDTPMAMQLVQQGFGISFLPASIIRTQPNAGIYSKPIRGLNVTSGAVLVWRPNQFAAPCVELFTQME